jgi:hypothetical protein
VLSWKCSYCLEIEWMAFCSHSLCESWVQLKGYITSGTMFWHYRLHAPLSQGKMWGKNSGVPCPPRMISEGKQPSINWVYPAAVPEFLCMKCMTGGSWAWGVFFLPCTLPLDCVFVWGLVMLGRRMLGKLGMGTKAHCKGNGRIGSIVSLCRCKTECSHDIVSCILILSSQPRPYQSPSKHLTLPQSVNKSTFYMAKASYFYSMWNCPMGWDAGTISVQISALWVVQASLPK